jgi:hypothetical protein
MPIKILLLDGRLDPRGWRRLLRRWGQLLDAYATPEPPARDAAYWYGERALTGLLAAAAWQIPKGWSLEEFTGRRGSVRRPRAGRGDKWLGTGRGRYTLEAKVAWPSTLSGNATREARRQLDLGAGQLKQLDARFRCGKGLALCYVVPSLHRTRNPLDNRSFQSLARDLLHGPIAHPAITAIHESRGKPFADGGRLYPGVILLGELVTWPRRRRRIRV